MPSPLNWMASENASETLNSTHWDDMDHTPRRLATSDRWRPAAIHQEPQERAISLPDGLIGCVRIVPGHFSSRSFDRMSRRQPQTALHAEARRRVSRKTST
jgi:hypothetical protein